MRPAATKRTSKLKTSLVLKPDGRLSRSATLTGPNAKGVSVAVGQAAAELEGRMKTRILQSKPSGRTYRLNAIVRKTGKRSIRNVKGLRRVNDGKSVIAGYNFHRASRRGQPPAVLSGRLINSIRGRRIGDFTGRVGVGVVYAPRLDNPNGLDRPFFMSTARDYRPRFLQLIRAAWFAGS